MSVENLKTTDDVRELLKNPDKLLDEFKRIVFYPMDYGERVHNEVSDVGDWYTSYFDVYRLDMEDREIYVGASYMVGNTENQDLEEVMEYDELFEVFPREVTEIVYERV